MKMTPLQTFLAALRQEELDPTLWMIPYSTLMLILMILFAALFSTSKLDALQYETAIVDLTGTGPGSPAKKEIVLTRSLKEFMESTDMSDKAQVFISARTIKMTISSPVLFDVGSASLKPEITPLLEKLLEHLRQMDNTVIVEGHTDNVPINNRFFSSNWELSAARAFSVIHFFINRGISPERLLAHGFGEFRPLFPNETEEGRAKNRRIEITILRGISRV